MHGYHSLLTFNVDWVTLKNTNTPVHILTRHPEARLGLRGNSVNSSYTETAAVLAVAIEPIEAAFSFGFTPSP